MVGCRVAATFEKVVKIHCKRLTMRISMHESCVPACC